MTLNDLHALTIDLTTPPSEPSGAQTSEYMEMPDTNSFISCSGLCA